MQYVYEFWSSYKYEIWFGMAMVGLICDGINQKYTLNRLKAIKKFVTRVYKNWN